MVSDVDEALLSLLRRELDAPGVEFASRPKAISGGFDTKIYGFELAGAHAQFGRPLVVRIFQDAAGPRRAAFEAAVQTAIAMQGYPCPAPLLVHTETESLGGACIVMPRVPGRPMIDTLLSRHLFAMPRILAEAHARLHALDAGQVLSALEKQGLPPPATRTSAWLAELRRAFEADDYPGLTSGLEWLEGNAPPPRGAPVICHMDFHPLNILAEGGRVTGVIDWAGCTIGEAAADVGIARVILALGPVNERGMVRVGIDVGRRWFARQYLREYRKRREVRIEDVRYFEAMRCFAAMLHLSERRLRALNPGGYAWSGEREVAALTGHFREVSGVTISPLTG